MIYTHVMNKGGRGGLSPLDGRTVVPLDGRTAVPLNGAAPHRIAQPAARYSVPDFTEVQRELYYFLMKSARGLPPLLDVIR